jgi:exportin-2 (importin alpha re-exporter)
LRAAVSHKYCSLLDSESRRRAANDLVRGLLEHFEAQLSPLFLNYIQQCLQSNDWKLHDTAIQLFIAVAMKGNLTQHGISFVNKNVNIDEFFVNYCVPYLKNDQTHPMLKSTTLLFAFIFRNQVIILFGFNSS